jgi:hypothetical protein
MLELKLPFVASLHPNPNEMDSWAEDKTNNSYRMYHGLNSCGLVWQNHLRNEGFVSQDYIGGFSTKRECTNTHT